NASVPPSGEGTHRGPAPAGRPGAATPATAAPDQTPRRADGPPPPQSETAAGLERQPDRGAHTACRRFRGTAGLIRMEPLALGIPPQGMHGIAIAPRPP